MIRLSKSCIGAEERQAVSLVLDSEFLGMGDTVRNFEKDLSLFLKRPAVCVSSGTAALHLALQAVGVGFGDEVIVQSLTYVASFQAISAAGATPVSCDIDPESLCMDLIDLESKITKKTKAIMPVHYSGGVGQLNEIYFIAKKYNLRVIEDGAHAFGSKYSGKRIGSFGDISCFSFDGIKNITSGEGGCIVTSDKRVLQKVKDARLLGIKGDTERRFSHERSWEFSVSNQGWRYHMSNIMAAIGIEQLKKHRVFFLKRQILAKKYDDIFDNVDNIKLINHDYNVIVPHIYIIQFSNRVNRAYIKKSLEDNGIQSGIHYYPNHRLALYKDSSVNLKNTDQIYPTILTLPLHPDLEIPDIEYVAKTLIDLINNE